MGTKLTAKRAGTCPECKKPWAIGDEAFWDNAVKNSAGFSVMCIDKDCFGEQGGKETPRGQGFNSQQGGFKSGWKPRPQIDVTLKVPEIKVGSVVKDSANKLKEYIVQADELVEELYSLPPGDQTRGQIRSKFIDQLIAIGKKGQ